MKILYITNRTSQKTGAGTYADLLVEGIGRRHEVKIYQSEDDLKIEWDIVHVTDIKHLKTELLRKIPHPLIIDIHDYYWTRFYPFFCIDLPLRYIFQVYRKYKYESFLKQADAVITHCAYVKERINHHSKYLVWIGIKPDNAIKQDVIRENLILFVGRDYFRKGIYHLIRSLPSVLKEVADARVLVVGQEYMHSKLFAKLLSRDLPINYIDGMNRNELLHLYKKAKVLVLPSNIEAFGIVNLEAMAAGTPIVATRVGGIPEVVRDGENGVLVDLGDIEGLSNGIIKCLTDREFAEAAAKKGFEILCSSFLSEQMIDSTEKVYIDILNKRGKCN